MDKPPRKPVPLADARAPQGGLAPETSVSQPFANEHRLSPGSITEATQKRYAPLVSAEKVAGPRPSNGLKSASAELASKLHATDPRILFVSSEETNADNHFSSQGAALYSERVGGALHAAIVEFLIHTNQHRPAESQITARDILIRSSPASLNGAVHAGEILVRDVRHICDTGLDRAVPQGEMGAISLAGFSTESKEIHTHVISAAAGQPSSIRATLEKYGATPNETEAVFPVVFVYEKKKTTAAGGYATLIDPNAASPVLAAFVLPRM